MTLLFIALMIGVGCLLAIYALAWDLFISWLQERQYKKDATKRFSNHG
jgi:hypothetical protein